jgi:zinc protease
MLAIAFSVSFPILAATPAASVDLEKAIQFPVEKYQLKNGLTVLLHPDPSLPAVSLHTWFRVGSKDEFVGRTGLAHFFEHMMFKGTGKYPMDTWGKYLNGKGAEPDRCMGRYSES